MPIEGNAIVGERLNEAVGNAVASGKAGDFVNEDLLDSAAHGQLKRSGEAVAALLVSRARDGLFADFDDLIALLGGVGGKLGCLSVGRSLGDSWKRGR